MRRPRVTSLLLSFATVPAAIALPVVTAQRPHAHPVRSIVRMLDLTGALHATRTPTFRMIGASWTPGALTAHALVQIRIHQDGTWSVWATLSRTDEAADPDSADARRAGTRVTSDPVWVGRADGVQARVLHGHRGLTHGVRLALVDPGASSADASVGPAAPLGGASAYAATTEPAIYTRAIWGADESIRTKACPAGPDYSATIKVGFVHHTDTDNSYTSSDVPSIIRSIYAYHVQSNGWCDIGYNFLIDRFGRIWEGRYGGINRAVIGAHTGGFNTDSFGVAAIGTFTTTQPSSGMLSAYEHLFAWKLGLYYRDPTSTDHLVSSGGGTDKWPVGQNVLFNRISGHRDAGNTTCPGDALYSRLTSIRYATRNLMGVVSMPLGDYTGDMATDSTGMATIDRRLVHEQGDQPTHLGMTGDDPVPGHYFGHYGTDRAVWRPSNGIWYVKGTSARVQFGAKRDIPVPADYNGDGVTDFAVWRPSNGVWYVHGTSSRVQFGMKGDIPVPGDYNGDGKTDIAVWRPSNGTWYVNGVYPRVQYGASGDIPVPGDYTGDGRTDYAVWRPGSGSWDVYGVNPHVQYGTKGDIPVPGNYHGAGITDPAVYRPSTGRWYVSGRPSVLVGTSTDEPVVLPYAIFHLAFGSAAPAARALSSRS